jgi:hypothetical protein
MRIVPVYIQGRCEQSGLPNEKVSRYTVRPGTLGLTLPCELRCRANTRRCSGVRVALKSTTSSGVSNSQLMSERPRLATSTLSWRDVYWSASQPGRVWTGVGARGVRLFKRARSSGDIGGVLFFAGVLLVGRMMESRLWKKPVGLGAG